MISGSRGRVRKGGEDVREAIITELILQDFHEFGPDAVLLVVFLVLVSFLDGGVAADGGDVDHAVSVVFIISNRNRIKMLSHATSFAAFRLQCLLASMFIEI